MAYDECSISGRNEDGVMASGNRREFEGGAGAVNPAGSIARAPVAPQSFGSGSGFRWVLLAARGVLCGILRVFRSYHAVLPSVAAG